jgi:hypothetical protein
VPADSAGADGDVEERARSADADAAADRAAAPQSAATDESSAGDPVTPLQSPPAPVPNATGSPRSDGRQARLVERSALLALAARPAELETVADGVVRVTDRSGGFVASSAVRADAESGGSASFELRVPTTRLARVLADLSRLAHVRERTQATEDITAQGVSAAERLADARRERASLLRQLDRAATLEQTRAIRARLRTVSRQIAAAKAARARVLNRARYATVGVTVVSDDSAGAAGETPDDGVWTPADALRDAGRILEVAAAVALVALAVLAPLALLGLLVVLAARTLTRHRRERTLDAA